MFVDAQPGSSNRAPDGSFVTLLCDKRRPTGRLKASHERAMTPHSRDMTLYPRDMTPHSRDMTLYPRDMTPHSRDMTLYPRDMTPHPVDVTPNEEDWASCRRQKASHVPL
jgi:hypothetical protein